MQNFIFNETSRLVEVFKRTLRLCKQDTELVFQIEEAKKRTELRDYKNIEFSTFFADEGKVVVSPRKTLDAAIDLKTTFTNERIAVLNFASPVQPGGGAIYGSQAQEEYLCRCTTLYPILNTQRLWEQYYLPHRFGPDRKYDDICIFSPNVVVVKKDDSDFEYLSQSNRFMIDVITCAAPNLNYNDLPLFGMDGEYTTLSDDELFEVHKNRAKSILNCAAINNVQHLVLGAFGCGAFRNNPRVVSRAYADVVSEYRHRFKTIDFAIYCPQNNTANYEEFVQALS